MTHAAGPSARSYRCSFCAKPADQTKKLIAGPGVYICDACIATCVELLDEHSAMPKARPWEIERSLDDVLRMLPEVVATVAQADDYLVHWVREARSLGATWARIGEALGMTRQAAWERFSGNE